MVIVRSPFKLYLLTMIALALLSACQSPETKRQKQFSTLRIHLESKTETTDRTQQAPIWREHPFTVNVQKVPFLTEANVAQASVIEVVGGFAVRIQFDHEGSLLLEQYSMLNPGKHFAIFSQSASPPDEKLNNGRWLAAPSISKHITNGVLVFTPDATREESDQIVLGLNNLAKRLEKAPEK
jgi:preprotein translocase subunit SecD